MEITENIKVALESDGWILECESPLEISKDGSRANGEAAEMVINMIVEHHNYQNQANKDMDAVLNCLKDPGCFGLEVEVLIWAMTALKNNPNMTIQDAVNYGYSEWVK